MNSSILSIGIFNLWILLVPAFLLVIAIMRVATALRRTPILNREDHRSSTIGTFLATFLLFLTLTVITPIVPGPFFWAGVVLIFPAGVFYILSIVSFLKKKEGLTIRGIYAVTRNPMYVAMLLFLGAFFLMALQASPLAAILFALADIVFFFLIRRRIKDEEAFLSETYGEEYRRYKESTHRYLGIKKHDG